MDRSDEVLMIGEEVFAASWTKYYDARTESDRSQASIYLDVRLPLDPEVGIMARLDTAAPYCIFEWPILEKLGLDDDDGAEFQVRIDTRLGIFTGSLHRTEILLPAMAGNSLQIDVTLFASRDWPGENFLGYTGFLQRIRCGIDPASSRFYFGSDQ